MAIRVLVPTLVRSIAEAASSVDKRVRRDDDVSMPADNSDHWSNLERFWDGFADIPWGLIAFVAIIVLLACGAFNAADVRALATASGLFGVGHGIHTASKHIGKPRPEQPSSSTVAVPPTPKPRKG